MTNYRQIAILHLRPTNLARAGFRRARKKLPLNQILLTLEGRKKELRGGATTRIDTISNTQSSSVTTSESGGHVAHNPLLRDRTGESSTTWSSPSSGFASRSSATSSPAAVSNRSKKAPNLYSSSFFRGVDLVD